MAVDSYTYGTVALVHDKIGWVVPARAVFSGSTVPTDTEVESVLDAIANEIHAMLLEHGYPADTKSSVTTDAPRAVGWLERLNVSGACADILQSFPVANDEETGYSPEKYWRKMYMSGLKLIKGQFLERMGLARTYEMSRQLVSTSTLDEDGNEKEPLFKRGQWKVPGTEAGIFPSEDISYGV